MIRKAALAAAFLILAPAMSASARETSPHLPVVYTAPGVPTVIATPDLAQPAAAVALWYRAPSSGFGAAPVPGLSRLSALTIAASTPITGTSLAQLVQNCGGELRISSYPESVSVTAVVPPEKAEAIARAMTADFFAPVIDEPGFAIAQREDAENVLYRSYDPPEALEDALGAALFASGSFHDGTIAASSAIAAIALAQVRTFAERAFRPANAIVVVTGNVSDFTGQYATREGSDVTAEAALPQPVVAAPARLQRIANVNGVGFGWTGPPISDESSATALDFIADMLFAPKVGAVTVALGSLKAEVTGKFVTYRDPGLFVVTVSGDDAAAAQPIVLRASAQAATPMNGAAFSLARAGFAYRLRSETQSPPALADTLGWYAVEGNPAYAPAAEQYFRVAQSLTPQSVARAARRYLTSAPAVVTLVRAKPTPRVKSS